MTVRQHSFYLEDEDWKALRHYCLDHGLSVSAFVAQAARDAIAGPVREIKEVKLHEVSLNSSGGLGIGATVVDAVGTTGAKITTATGAPAIIPVNPVRAVPKPSAQKKVRARS